MKKYTRFIYGIFSVLLMVLLFCPARAQQVQKKNLLPADYTLWSTLHDEQLSDYGNWISYHLRYTSPSDTLFVKNTGTKDKLYVFPNCKNGQFAGESMFGCIDREKNLVLLDLTKGTTIKIPAVNSFEFSSDGRFLVTFEKNDATTSNLSVRKFDGKILEKINNVIAYKMNPALNGLVYASTTERRVKVGLVALSNAPVFSAVLTDTLSKIQRITWSKNGGAFAFYDKALKSRLFYYRIDGRKLSVLKDLPSGKDGTPEIFASEYTDLSISDDLSKVFFSCIGPPIILTPKPVVEIWNGNDKYLYPLREMAASYNKPFLAVWWPETAKTRAINSKEFSWMSLTGNQQYAVLADPSRYEPQYDLFAPMDYYIQDIETGKQQLLVQNQSGEAYEMSFSPDGKYICYHKDNAWNIYNILEKRHADLTSGLDTTFQSVIENRATRRTSAYTFQGWSSDGRSVLINDQYDVWQVFLDGRLPLKLTRGKEQQICFRLVDIEKQSLLKYNYSLPSGRMYDMSKVNILEAYHIVNGTTGYFKLHPSTGVQSLVYQEALLTKILKAAKNDTYLFKSENFDKSPSLLIKSIKKAEVRSIVATNPQQKHFHWGLSEMIHFENAQNKVLNGALFYPANYDPAVKYPMIVYIYETLSKRLHRYVNPSALSMEGFNITQLTSNGYFVLMPDIEYEKGNPAISATDCVESAVKSIIAKGLINPSKVGIMGHSFGGYETNFIITKSKLFAAAISGAGVSDIIRGYLTLNGEGHNNPEIWRYENQQYRMKNSFYEDKNSYYRNSPVHNAENIQTPLLIWTGKDDNNVKPEQSIAFHIALRRLKKEHILLQYPGEGHALRTAGPQKDLSEKVLEWFGYYLKGEKPKEWIANGIKFN